MVTGAVADGEVAGAEVLTTEALGVLLEPGPIEKPPVLAKTVLMLPTSTAFKVYPPLRKIKLRTEGQGCFCERTL